MKARRYWARRPWLAAAALLVAVGGSLVPTTAVPLAVGDATRHDGPDAGGAVAQDLAVQAVLRVTDAERERLDAPRVTTT